MYGFTLWLHSTLRWFVLIFLLVALVQAYTGWFQNKAWGKGHKVPNLLLMIFADLQLLLGLFMYFITSQIVQSAFKGGMGAAMKNNVMRFWAVEHISMMLLAIVLIHIGYAKAKRAESAVQKHKAAAIFFTIALVVIFAAIPWPFRGEVARVLFRPWF